MNKLYLSSCLLLASSLSACASFGGNVNGDFVCRAPDGICSPTSNIDDQALALMTGPEGGSSSRSAPASVQPGQGLKIVLPARVDRYGRAREKAVVYTQLDSLPEPASAPARSQLSFVELAAKAPELSMIGESGVQSNVRAPLVGDPRERIQAEVIGKLKPRPQFVSIPVVQGVELSDENKAVLAGGEDGAPEVGSSSDQAEADGGFARPISAPAFSSGEIGEE